jgi:hypothetical protein
MQETIKVRVASRVVRTSNPIRKHPREKKKTQSKENKKIQNNSNKYKPSVS